MRIGIGAMCDPLEEQAKEQGCKIKNVAHYQEDIHAYNRLRIRGYITDSQSVIVCKKIIKAIGENSTHIGNI